MINAIILGIHGRDGYYLNKLLWQNNVQVDNIGRYKGDCICGDVSDNAFAEKLIRKHQPDYIFLFAAESKTRHVALYQI